MRFVVGVMGPAKGIALIDGIDGAAAALQVHQQQRDRRGRHPRDPRGQPQRDAEEDARLRAARVLPFVDAAGARLGVAAVVAVYPYSVVRA